jgi:hypothetical protein
MSFSKIIGCKYGCFLGIMLLFPNYLLGQELHSSCSLKLQIAVVDLQGKPLAYVNVGVSGQSIGGSTEYSGQTEPLNPGQTEPVIPGQTEPLIPVKLSHLRV